MKIILPNKFGFTLPEMLVAIAIMAVLSTAVIVNYRGGQKSQELEVSRKQVESLLSTAKNYNLAGKLTDGVIPENGYALKFSTQPGQESSVVLLAQLATPKVLITDRLFNVKIVSLWALQDSTITGAVGTGNWFDLGSDLQIIFSAPDKITITSTNFLTNPRFVGGILEHARTGQRAYFYLSIDTGLIVTEKL